MRTKIIATVGPASESEEVLMRLLKEGVNVFRLNMSHGTNSWHRTMIKRIRDISKDAGIHAAILGDLQGPKIRMGIFDEVQIHRKEILSFSCAEETPKGCYPVDYSKFAEDVRPGEEILVDDGKLLLKTIESDGKSLVTLEVIQGGILKPRKGINLPGTVLSQPAITAKDKTDLNLLLEEKVDWIALSFVRSADDIRELRQAIPEDGPKVIAKIEKPEALENIDAIIRISDAVMIARGDLGIEIPIQQVPLIQKDIIHKCLDAGRPVVVATQMMESMITGITPSRAEVNDVANSVMDGADAVMLSGETSVGSYPTQTVNMVSRIIDDVEQFDGIYYKHEAPKDTDDDRYISDFVIHSACKLAQKAGAAAMSAMTHSGYSGFKMASHRPRARIFIFTNNYRLLNQFSLVWGVEGIYYDSFVSTDQTIGDVKQILKGLGQLSTGDLLVNVASMPISDRGKTNTLKLSEI